MCSKCAVTPPKTGFLTGVHPSQFNVNEVLGSIPVEATSVGVGYIDHRAPGLIDDPSR